MDRAHLAALHGVATSYEPAPGQSVPVPEETVVAVLAALGVDASTPRAVRDALDAHARAEQGRLLPPAVVLREGDVPRVPDLPEGTELRVGTADGDGLPWDGELPVGTHLLRARTPDGRSAAAPLVVAPRLLPQPPARCHGFLVQLYSLLSARSWGMGDLGDLAELAAWSGRSFGADFVQVNPLHAAVPGFPGRPADPSPYRPSSRRFPDPVHLRVEEITEFGYLAGEDREEAQRLLARAGELREAVLRGGEPIDHDAVRALKLRALELVRHVPPSPGRRAAYCDFLAEQGQALDDHATWCALAEVYGPDWHRWPGGLKDPRSARTARARGELLDRVDFHCWLAWLTDRQLAAA
ncbi:4-alpha-glucanotransferase, partial [Streptomyces thioluteus]|uniref:4-alpha-glucanotransferase n=1 Tax=Streptomyces thioluteus TaxID=66431 RepID=UPI0031E5729E